MGYGKFYHLASRKSFWRGYDYYKNGQVKSIKKIHDDMYETSVESVSTHERYKVCLDLNKPRSSTCTCPFTKDKKRICKHMVSSYFAIFPEEFKLVNDEIEAENREMEERQKRLEELLNKKYEEIKQEVSKWSKEQLINYVVNTKMDEIDTYTLTDGEFEDEEEDYYNHRYW